MLEEVEKKKNRPRTTAKLSKLSLSVIHQKERFGTAGMIIICVPQSTPVDIRTELGRNLEQS